MKKLAIICILAWGILATAFAQSPDAFNYQALVRDAAGQVLPNTQVAFRISLSDPASPEAPTYTEIHHATTDAFGRVALQIGQGKPVNGLSSELDWANAQYALQVELDAQGGSDFERLGSTQLLSVPYAFHARTVEIDQVDDADADPRNELQMLQLTGDTLHITDGNYVLLPLTMTGNPESGGQILSLENDTLSISDGNGVFMEDYVVGEMSEALEEGKITFDYWYDEELEQPDWNIALVSTGSPYEIWQSFTPAVSGGLSGIEVGFYESGSYSAPDTVTLSIYEGEGTSGNVLYSALAAVGTGSTWHSLEFNGQVNLSADSLYTFAVEDGDQFYYYAHLTNPYAGGRSNYNGGTADLVFAVHLVPTTLSSSVAISVDTILGTVSLSRNTLNVTQTGKVGIGTSAPEQTLHVTGSVRIEDGNQQNGYILACDDDGTASWSNPASLFTDNDDQTLALSGTTLSISGGNNVNLSNIDTDDQVLSFSDATLSIADGNSVDISSFEDSDFSLSRANASSTTKILKIEGQRSGGYTTGNFAEIQFKNTDNNSGGSGTPYIGAKIASANTDGSQDGDLRFYTTNAYPIPQQQMIITNDGEFGFGTDDPDYAFDLVQNKNDDFVARIRNIANSNSSPDHGLLIQAGHNSYNSSHQSTFIQFETPNGSYCGRIKQDGGSSVNYYDASDRRLKENITDTRYGLQDLLKIRVRDYNYIADGPAQQRTGFIAQELHEVYPTAVDKGGEDVKTEPWSVAYGKLTPVLVQAVQDQQKLIEAQADKIAALEAQLAHFQQLAEMVDEINARLKDVERTQPDQQAGGSQVMR